MGSVRFIGTFIAVPEGNCGVTGSVLGRATCGSTPGNGSSFLNLVSAIVIYKEGRGGRYFWNKKKLPVSRSLRGKIYQETLASLGLAQQLLPLLRKKLNGDEYDLEIHIDVGSAGQTRDMIKEVVAMVGGNGFKAKTKPGSYGASSVADKYT